MGLDMYLYKKMYVRNWDHMKPKERHTITVKFGGKKRVDIKPERISEVTEQVMYWRKANHIHKWFVDNVQNGKDDCGEHEVSREQLTQLRDLCKKVVDSTKLVDGEIVAHYTFEKDGVDAKGKGKYKKVPHMQKGKIMEDPSVAKALLPGCEGFFFGSTEYDQWYYEDTRRTAEELTALLGEPETASKTGRPWPGSFVYHSSW